MSSSTDVDHFIGKVTQKAVLLNPGGKVLVTEVGDHWELPGGRFEPNETLVGSLRRELHEELGISCRVGPPVETMYGGWHDDETGDPMVTIIYRCETHQREIELNEEHDDYEWLEPEVATDRFSGGIADRIQLAIERAVVLDSEVPFESVTDPYAGSDVDTGELLEHLAAMRAKDT